jgi:hypothetical protein
MFQTRRTLPWKDIRGSFMFGFEGSFGEIRKVGILREEVTLFSVYCKNIIYLYPEKLQEKNWKVTGIISLLLPHM